MSNCFFCNKVCEEKDPVEVKCSLPWFKMCACSKCVRDILIKRNSNYIYHDWILWTADSRPDKRICCVCWVKFIPSDRVVKYYQNTGDSPVSDVNPYCRCPKCMKLASVRNVYCFECKCYHKKWHHLTDWIQHKFKSSYWWSWDLHFVWLKDSKSWNTWWSEEMVTNVDKIKLIEQLPFQEIRNLPTDAIRTLDSFYRRGSTLHCTEHYNFWDNINITWEIKLKFGWFEQWLKEAMFWVWSYCSYDNDNSKLKWVKRSDLMEWIKQNKYRNMYFDSIDDDWYVVWKYIDIFWTPREKRESINVFYQAQQLDVNNNSAVMNLKYVLSSDIKHKVEAFSRNDEWNFNSCQRSGNRDWLARWAYDTVTNGCICPILIYKNNNMNRAVWRITTRIMYDKDWEMYILLERLYHDWSFSKQSEKWEVYKAIIEDIKNQGYNVIVSNYSAHDNSTLNYVQSLWLKHTWILTDLYQPLRQLFKASPRERSGYYADWWTECLWIEINWLQRTTDYLDKAYLL